MQCSVQGIDFVLLFRLGNLVSRGWSFLTRCHLSSGWFVEGVGRIVFIANNRLLRFLPVSSGGEINVDVYFFKRLGRRGCG